jgi:transaldolase
MKINALKQLEALGQSIWLDYIRKDLITSGDLLRLIEEDRLRGMTSNPALFAKAFGESREYEDDIQALVKKGKGAAEIYEALALRDVQRAADVFRPYYDRLDGRDGYVSLEVNPHLAHDTEGTVQEARRLWKALDRPNVFIKVPATVEGLPAIQRLISEGINVNITLLFGLSRYRQVVEAYLAGIQARLAAGKDVSRTASVASFFLSRIDTLIDPQLDKLILKGGPNAAAAKQALGRVAIASAKVAYQTFKDLFGTARFKDMELKGARVQRLLWASTGTKNPAYGDTRYLDELIGPETVNTVPVETLDAFRDHGVAGATLERDLQGASGTLALLPGLGIDLDAVAQKLEDEGVEKFNQPFDQLLASLAERTSSPAGRP